MRLSRLFVGALLAFFGPQWAFAQQPYAGAWFPEDIKKWSPENDKNAKFNRSRVKLAKRFMEPALMKANKNQYAEGQVTNESVTAKMCSQCPSQGINNFISYNPTYWQYMEKFINWGGADDEGIIIFPPAGAIDAAHQSGVKILATMFFQNTTVGRNGVNTMLTQENGTYPYAEKLYEMAKYFGFDGYFINDESFVTGAASWEPFVKAFMAAARKAGDTNMEIQWYDASDYPNVSMLKTDENTSHFVDYGGGAQDYRGYAEQIGCTVDQTFHKIYGGIECTRSGLTGYGSSLNEAYPTTGHVGSLALFCPEEYSWKKAGVENLFFTPDASGPKAYEAIRKTFENENKVWVNEKGDPSQIIEGEPTGWQAPWRGFSGCLVERSTISSMPFITNFSVGCGKHRFVKGVSSYTEDWSHPGTQSILPTWRWWIENKGDLKVTIDWDDAYNMGSSFKIAGKLTKGDHLTRLYKTMVKVENGGTLRLVYKTSAAGSVEVKVGTESDVKNGIVALGSPKTTEENGWTVAEYDLSQLNGKTIYMVALNLKADADIADYSLNLGQLALLPAGYAPTAPTIKNLATTSTLSDEGGDLRITWDWDENADLEHFDVYRVLADGTKQLVGQTRDEAFYIPDFKRNGSDDFVKIEVVPVLKNDTYGASQTLQVDYPKATAPVISIKSTQNWLKVGDKITLTATGTYGPTACKWTLPEGVELVGGSLDDFTITLKATSEGEKTVKVELTNAIGTSEKSLNVFNVLSASDYSSVKNVALRKTVVSVSSGTQGGDYLLDGAIEDLSSYYGSNAWRGTSTTPEAVIDLGGAFQVYGFRIVDSKFNNNSTPNLSNYRIFVSSDGKTYNEVINATDGASINDKKDYIQPIAARYVKLAPYAKDRFSFNIYEFEVYGKDFSKMVVDVPSTFEVNAGQTKNLVVKYNLNGDVRNEKFSCKAVPSNANVSIGEIVEDNANGTFTIPVIAQKVISSAQIKITVDNYDSYRESTVDVTIASPDAKNVLSGAKAELRKYKSDYNSQAEYDVFETTDLTDGDKAAEGCGAIEDASTYSNDVWAVFTAPETWNLANVKVFLPNNNQGEDENGETGTVNKTISLRTSNDGTNWTVLKEFTGLDNVSELQYTLPQFVNCKYLAVVCDVNYLFYASLAEVEAQEQLAEATPVERPVGIKGGFNADVIAESTPVADHVNNGIDGAKNVFYTTDVKSSGAICKADGKIESISGKVYQLGTLASNNVLRIGGDVAEGTLEFTAPVQAEELYILGTSADGATSLKAVINYTDGTKSESTVTVSDWGAYSANGIAVKNLGRVQYDTDSYDRYSSYKLYEQTLNADLAKKVESITFTNDSKSACSIFAISMKGRNTATGVKGISSEKNVEAVGIYTIDGMKVNTLQKGINIVRYSDGSAKKVFVK